MSYKEREPRKSVTLEIHLKDFSLTKSAEEDSVNLSRGGVFVKMDTPFPEGTLIKFELKADEDKTINGAGRVVWSRKESNGEKDPPGIGVKFLKLAKESQALLDTILEKAELVAVEPPPADERAAAEPDESEDAPKTDPAPGAEAATDATPYKPAPKPEPAPEPESTSKPESSSEPDVKPDSAAAKTVDAAETPEDKTDDTDTADNASESEKAEDENKSDVPASDTPTETSKNDEDGDRDEDENKDKDKAVASAPAAPEADKPASKPADPEREKTPDAVSAPAYKPPKQGISPIVWIVAIVIVAILVWQLATSSDDDAKEDATVNRDIPEKTTFRDGEKVISSALKDQMPKAPQAEAKPAEPAPAADEAKPEAAAEEAPVEEAPAVDPENLSEVRIRTNPKGAEITIAGVAQEGVTPLTAKIETGKEVEITAHKAGFLTHKAPFVPEEKEAKLDIELDAARIKFRMNSKPDGTRIILDGKWNGNTPYTFLRRKYKPLFEFKLEKRGFEDIEGTVTEKDWVEEGRFYVFSFDEPLQPKKAAPDEAEEPAE